MSTYSPDLRIELITTGDQAGTWGTTTNTNLGTIIEDAISGYVTVSVTSANQAFTALNGAADEARNAMIRLTTTTGAAFAVYAPPVSKQYIIWNNSGQAATIYNSTVIGNTTAAGTGVAIANGDKVVVFSDGTSFYEIKTANVTGTVAIANGGTGQTTANAAFNALAPSQTGNSGKYLTTNGTNTSWDAIDISTADITGVLPAANGGTGVNNSGKTITLGGNLTTSGAFNTTLTATNTTAITLPTTGTLATLAGTETLTNKTLTSPTLTTPALGIPSSGTLTNCTGLPNTGLVNSSITINGSSVSLGGSTTVTAVNPNALTIGTGLSGTSYNGSSAVTIAIDSTVATLTGAQTLTNKTLTSPTLTTPALGTPVSGNFSSGTFTWPLFNQNTTGTAAGLSTTLAVASGGTGRTSYTANGVLYASGTTTLATDNGFVYDGTNVGVGTNTPSTYGKFVVATPGSFTSALVSVSSTASEKPTLEFRKTGNTASVVTNEIGSISWYSQQNTTTYRAAYVEATDYRNINSQPQLKLAAFFGPSTSESSIILKATLSGSGGTSINYNADLHSFAGDANFNADLTVNTIPVVTTTDSQTLTNKTLSSNTIATTQATTDNSTKLATTAFVQAALQLLYPVGTIYSSTVATNPGTLFGFGTWTAYAAGRVLIGDGGGFTAGATGGSADAIVVSHTHTATVTDPGHVHAQVGYVGGTFLYSGGGGSSGIGTPYQASANTASATTGISVSNSTTGSSGTNANLQPYVVVYMWQRTA